MTKPNTLAKARTIRSTLLEAWAFYKAGSLSTDEMLSRLRGEKTKPNDKMIIGTLYHSYLATGVVEDGSGFRIDTASARKHFISPGEPVIQYEVPILEGFGDYYLSGTLDAITMDGVLEFKTSDKKKGYLDYYPSLQWRVYALLTGLPVTYHFYQYRLKGSVVHTTGHDCFTFCGTRHAEGEVRAACFELLRFADVNEMGSRCVARAGGDPGIY